MAQKSPVHPIHRGRPLLYRDLAESGIPRSRIRAGDVAHPHRAVHIIGAAPDGVRERAEALLPVLRPGEAFSHTTAAALYGAPVPRSGDAHVHVTAVGGPDRMRRPGVIGHRAAHLPCTTLGVLPLIEAAHGWAQLASMLGHDDLVAVGDYLVTPDRHRKTPALATVDALNAAVGPGARGAARARRALADVRVGAESRMETLTRLILVRAGLPEPEVNPALPVAGIELHPDLFYRAERIVLEYEGDGHRTDARAWRQDISRREAFQAAGYRVIQVHKDDVLVEPEQLVDRVARAIAQRRRS